MLTPASADQDTSAIPAPVPHEVHEAASLLDDRFPSHQTHHRASSMFETKAVLKDSLARAKEQLSSETIRASSLARDLNDTQADLQIARDALKETRHRLQDSYNQNQKLEKTIQDLRQSARKGSWATISGAPDSSTPDTSPSLSRSNTADSVLSSTGGLRELRLGRSGSQKREPPPPQQFGKRSSSLATQTVLSSTENHAPADNESLLLELVNAKTAEAVAKQELEELKNRFESLRKVMSVTPSGGGGMSTPTNGSTSANTTPQPTPPAITAAGVVNVLWGKKEKEKEGASSSSSSGSPAAATNAPAPATTGTGWGWTGWKRSVSTNNASIS